MFSRFWHALAARIFSDSLGAVARLRLKHRAGATKTPGTPTLASHTYRVPRTWWEYVGM